MLLSLMSNGYIKSLRTKPQTDYRLHYKSCRIILNNSETSRVMFWVLSNVRDNLLETLPNFYHRLHIRDHDTSSNFKIFELRLLFIEF
jgi:hypothetical protein